MSFPKPPEKIVAFNSGAVAPHDIGRQFDEHRRGISNVIEFLRTVVRDDGVVKNGTVGPEQLAPDLPEILAKRAVGAIEDLLASVRQSASQAAVSAREAEQLRDQFELLQRRVAAAADQMARASEEVQMRLRGLDAEIEARVSALIPAGMLGSQHSNFYATDEQSAGPLSSDYAQVSIAWAEYMPDTIPPNILAINAITGDHWSSRWWANRSANAFGMLAWWYQGAWPQPGPPSTPNTPAGQPLPPGSIYFDTTLGVMMVWNGSTWVNATAPQKGATASLYYLASAGQTVFSLGTADRNGKTFAFNQNAPEGVQAYVNGVRLEPVYDFTVDTVGSSITFLRGLTLNSIVTFDLLTPASQLAPSGSANTVLLNPITPDGTTTHFTGLTVAANGNAVNVAKNEELLVSVNGVQQSPGAAYNASGATITFAEAPEAAALVFIIWFGPATTTRAVAPASVWSAADAAANGMTVSNGGLTVTPSGFAGNQAIRGSTSHNTGKYYVEFLNTVAAITDYMMVGLADATFNATNEYLGSNGVSVGVQFAGASYTTSGFTSLIPSAAITPNANDVFAIAIDFTAGKVWLSWNNGWLSSGNPVTGANPFITIAAPALGIALFPGMTFYGSNEGVWTLQPTAASQKYAPPAGFSAWDGS